MLWLWAMAISIWSMHGLENFDSERGCQHERTTGYKAYPELFSPRVQYMVRAGLPFNRTSRGVLLGKPCLTSGEIEWCGSWSVGFMK
jgi:hypothetical protein